MDKKTKKEFEKFIKGTAQDYMKFKVEVLLLFDRYDPFDPNTSITPEQFFSTIWLETKNLHHHMLMTFEQMDGKIPPFCKLPKDDDDFWVKP